MSVQAAVSGQPRRNNGATVKKGGNIDSTPTVTNVRSELNDAFDDGYGAKVSLAVSEISSGNLGTFNAMTNFAYPMQDGVWLGKKLTTAVNGVANDWLRSCARYDGYRNPALLETTRVYGSGVNTSWDYVTGVISKGTSAGEVASFGLDHAARPTDAVPGELVYKTGAKVPVQDDYKPRTNP